MTQLCTQLGCQDAIDTEAERTVERVEAEDLNRAAVSWTHESHEPLRGFMTFLLPDRRVSVFSWPSTEDRPHVLIYDQHQNLTYMYHGKLAEDHWRTSERSSRISMRKACGSYRAKC